MPISHLSPGTSAAMLSMLLDCIPALYSKQEALMLASSAPRSKLAGVRSVCRWCDWLFGVMKSTVMLFDQQFGV
jgi:hypothetical protein